MSYRPIDISRFCYALMPLPVYIVTSKRPDGGLNAMTAAWVMPVSRRPPLLAVAIAPTRFTYECIRYSGEFTISILPPGLKDLAEYFGSVSGRNVDKFKERNVELVGLSKVATPGIKGALAIIGCKLWRDYEGGDHRLIIGEVVEALALEGKFEEFWRNVELLYYYGGGNYLDVRIP